MSVMDEIRKLDEQKAKLLHGAKQEAIDLINGGIKTLNELGFKFHLVEEGTLPAKPARTGTRRTGIREEVLALVKANPGASRSSLIKLMGIADDKSGQQSLSNALAALKKAGTITAENGAYKAK